MSDFDAFINSLAMEGYFLDDKKEDFNLELWAPGEHNILFVTGISGSGKTTLANALEEQRNAVMFELDGIDYHYDSSGNAKLLEKLEKKFSAYRNIVEQNEVSEHRALPINGSLFHDMFMELINLMHADPNTLYIIEGVQIIAFAEKWMFEEPLIIKGTSMVKSLFRRFRRNGNGKIVWSNVFQNELRQLIAYYLDSEKELKRFKRLR